MGDFNLEEENPRAQKLLSQIIDFHSTLEVRANPNQGNDSTHYSNADKGRRIDRIFAYDPLQSAGAAQFQINVDRKNKNCGETQAGHAIIRFSIQPASSDNRIPAQNEYKAIPPHIFIRRDL